MILKTLPSLICCTTSKQRRLFWFVEEENTSFKCLLFFNSFHHNRPNISIKSCVRFSFYNKKKNWYLSHSINELTFSIFQFFCLDFIFYHVRFVFSSYAVDLRNYCTNYLFVTCPTFSLANDVISHFSTSSSDSNHSCISGLLCVWYASISSFFDNEKKSTDTSIILRLVYGNAKVRNTRTTIR